MFDPLTIGLGIAGFLAYRKRTTNNFGVLTAEREEIYLNAIEHLQDATKLKKLADEFEKQGLKIQAKLLRGRAAWRGRSDATKEQHEAIYTKALLSENPEAILEVAKAFEAQTATVKAARLYARVNELRERQQQEQLDALRPKPAKVKVPRSTEVPAEPEPLESVTETH